jgi:hypothetical protein
VSVFPDDVGRLSGFNKAQLISQEFLLRRQLSTPEVVLWLKFFSNDFAIFLFESNESINRANKVINVGILELHDLFLNLSSFVVSLEHNVLTAQLKQLNKFVIVESENNIGDSDLSDVEAILLTLFFDTLGLLLHMLELHVELSLELFLDVRLKMHSNGLHTDGLARQMVLLMRGALVVILNERLVHLLCDFHLHGVITWSDGEHVPLDLVELTMSLEVVEAGQVNKDHENTEACNLGCHLVLLKELLLILLAGEADKSAGIAVGATFGDCCLASMAITTKDILEGEGVHVCPLSLIGLTLASVSIDNVSVDSTLNCACLDGKLFRVANIFPGLVSMNHAEVSNGGKLSIWAFHWKGHQ